MADRSLSWLKEIEIDDLLEKDPKLIFEWCGIDTLINMWEHFSSMGLYMTTAPLDKIKRRYIKKYFTGSNIKELCAKLDVSERFIYKVLEEKGIVHEKQEGLF